MNSQKQTILNMLLDKPWVCVTEMMSAFIPDYRRRLCDLKEDYILESRPCTQHDHKSKTLKEWHLVEKKLPEIIKEEVKQFYQGKLLEVPIENTLRFARPHNSVFHPTSKPVELVEYLIKNHSKEGDIILDLCGGGGTTLLAA